MKVHLTTCPVCGANPARGDHVIGGEIPATGVMPNGDRIALRDAVPFTVQVCDGECWRAITQGLALDNVSMEVPDAN